MPARQCNRNESDGASTTMATMREKWANNDDTRTWEDSVDVSAITMDDVSATRVTGGQQRRGQN